MPIELVDIVNGIMSTISFLVSITIVLLMFARYLKTRNKEIFYITISTFGIIWTYSSTVVSFFTLLITQDPLPKEIYFILGNFLYPLTLGCWIFLVLYLTNVKNPKLYSAITFIIMLIFDIIFILLSVIQPNMIGVREGNIDIRFIEYGSIYQLISIIFVWLGMLIFLKDTLRIDSKKIKLKAYLIFISLLIFTIAASFDGYVDLNIPQLIVARTFVILASIIAYIGWFFPKSVKKIFIKEK